MYYTDKHGQRVKPKDKSKRWRNKGIINSAPMLATIRKNGRCTRLQNEALMRMGVSVPPGTKMVP
jgi:hypothetical protein